MNELIAQLKHLIGMVFLSLPLAPGTIQNISLNVLPGAAIEIYVNNTASIKKVGVQNLCPGPADLISVTTNPSISNINHGRQQTRFEVVDFCLNPGQRLYAVGTGASPSLGLIQY